MKVPGGLQCITTQEGFTIHLNIISRLPYTNLRHYTDKELKYLPHVIFTSDITWDPTILDNIISENKNGLILYLVMLKIFYHCLAYMGTT